MWVISSCTSAMALVTTTESGVMECYNASSGSSGDEYEDAQESPLEQCITDSMIPNKDSGLGGNLFSLIPSGVHARKPSQTTSDDIPVQPISSPDSFSDFFTTLVSHSRSKSPRSKLPNPRDRGTYNLWSILKNLVGKDVTKSALPVHLNEPLSFTQRLVEDLEYSELCHKVAAAPTVHKRLAYLAALSSSCFVTTLSRHSKPFNPLLGETYELVNQGSNYCVVSEQVSHHPPVTALHAESDKWIFWEEYKLDIKFRGQWVRIQPNGLVHFQTKDDGYHYSWNKPHTTVHNLIIGSLWADQEAEVIINCHNTGGKAVVQWSPYSKAKERYRELNGKVMDENGEVQFLLHGAWDKGMTRKKPDGTGVKELWRAHDPIPNCERQYGYTQFALSLNEEDSTITCPTDSRKRVDQRLLEEGMVEEASTEKFRLEEKQRAARKSREARKDKWKPLWFDMYNDEDTGTSYYKFNGRYWDKRLKEDWSQCPDIF